MFTADKSVLLEVLDNAARAVASAPINPILDSVLLELAGDQLSITGSDGQVQVTARCAVKPHQAKPAKKAAKKGGGAHRVAVNAKKLSNILRNISSDETTVNLEDSSLVITSETGRFLLAFRPGEEYPQPASAGSGSLSIELDQGQLLRALRRLQAAISTKVHRQFLAGAYFDFCTEGLQLVATDGHRLALDLLKITSKSKLEAGFIVPRKAVYELGRIIGDAEDATLRLSAVKDGDVYRSACFETASVRLIAQLIVAQYPDYRRVIPSQDKNHQHLVFDRLKLLEAVRQVCTVHDRAGDAVRLAAAGDGRVVLKAEGTRQQDHAQVQVSVENDSTAELQTSINSTYLQDMLGAFEGFPKVDFAFHDGESSILCLPADARGAQLQYVVMPVR